MLSLNAGAGSMKWLALGTLVIVLLGVALRVACYFELGPDATSPASPPGRMQHAASVEQLVFSPDGKVLVSSSWDGTLRLWDVSTGNEIRQFALGANTMLVSTEHGLHLFRSGNEFSFFAISPDGMALAANKADKLHFWEVSTGKSLGQCE